jgi:predicted metal-binding membrane protein
MRERIVVRAGLLISGAFSVFFILFVGFALTFSPEARLMPLVVGVPAAVLALLQFFHELRFSQLAEGRRFTHQDISQAGIMLAWFTGLVLSTIAIGVLAATALFLAFFLYLHHRRNLIYAVAISAGFSSVIYLFFTSALGIELFKGILLSI